MSAVSFPEQPIAGFKVQLSSTGDNCSLVCAGTIDGKDPTIGLQPHLLALHEQLLASNMKTVKLDLTAVDYMNSSGVKCFMMWFIKVERSKTRYAIEILFDPQRTWQYVSFTTMGRIAPNVLKTTAAAKATPA